MAKFGITIKRSVKWLLGITIKRNVKWLILALLVIGVIVFTYYHFNVVEGATVKCDNLKCNKALNRYRKNGHYPVKLWKREETVVDANE